MTIVGHAAINGALERLGIGGYTGKAISSALIYIQMEPELGLWAARTEATLLDFIDDCAMLGKWGIEPFGIIDTIRVYLGELRDFLGEVDNNDGKTRKINAGIHGFMCACGEF